MKKTEDEFSTKRRNLLKMMAVGSTAGVTGLFGNSRARAESYE